MALVCSCAWSHSTHVEMHWDLLFSSPWVFPSQNSTFSLTPFFFYSLIHFDFKKWRWVGGDSVNNKVVLPRKLNTRSENVFNYGNVHLTTVNRKMTKKKNREHLQASTLSFYMWSAEPLFRLPCLRIVRHRGRLVSGKEAAARWINAFLFLCNLFRKHII